MPRFVVLQHDPPPGSTEPVHWDFMLEQEGVLLTWALSATPDTNGPIAARKLADHRLAYLDFEGEISGGRGSVTRWDRGEWELLESTETELRVRLSGARVGGEAVLSRETSDGNWDYLLSSRPDSVS